MARSLSLAAYMVYARRATEVLHPPEGARPEGELVWMHAANAAQADVLCQLAGRLAQLRQGLHVLLTLPDGLTAPARKPACVIVQTLPEDSVIAAQTFLAHWRPYVCLWTGGELRPALLSEADARAVPLYLIDASEEQFDRSSWRWFPDLPRSVLQRFAQIQVRSPEAARLLRRLGIADDDILQVSPLRAEAAPLPFNEDEREEVAQMLRGRPVWLAAHLHPKELATIIETRSIVSRKSHRLIVVIAPKRLEDLEDMHAELEAAGLSVARWYDGDIPSETTQIILSEPGEELGLWYRVAPVSFLGSSLFPEMGGHDPNEAAVHGSAILYGPNMRNHLSTYSLFAEARAARIVRDAQTLAAAVVQLIAPDQAAMMAHAAWDVASQGADATDRLLDLVQDTLDCAVEDG